MKKRQSNTKNPNMKNHLAHLIALYLITSGCQQNTTTVKHTPLQKFFYHKIASLEEYTPQHVIDDNFITLSAFMI